ncbi:hypothetical protein [Rossellomorea vietnamensis]|uniref:hypothetical protein n=1 Tax=Rossellomorea vietnamensis TaxID=218284 RepID=UPI000555E247|nr:hypothetical protein [Rossellomorea vietnamensis]
MKITIEGQPLIEPQDGHLLNELISVFKEYPDSLEFFMEIFNQYPNKNKFSEENLEKLVNGLVKDYPKIQEKAKEEIVKAVKLIYQKTENEISDLRGDLVEIIVADLGPQNSEHFTSCYTIKDGQFFQDGKRIGEQEGYSDSNVDSVFHSKKEYENLNEVCCESFECKASLSSYLYVVRGKRPPSIIDEKKYSKLKYLEYLNAFFKSGKLFQISFATFQRNLQRDSKKLRKMKINDLGILGCSDIAEAWMRKYS